jgi:hypothetical protein
LPEEQGDTIDSQPDARLSSLPTNARFRFPDRAKVYVARGNQWYSSPEGYDGGPWYAPEDPRVIPEETPPCNSPST